MIQFTASQIATLCNGIIIGDDNTMVDSFADLESAKCNQLSFLYNEKYENFLYTTQAGIVLINDTYILKNSITTTCIIVENSYRALALLLQYYEKITNTNKIGIEENVHIHPTAKIGNNAYIGAFAYIANNVKIGNNCKIYPQTFIDENTQIGENTLIYSGVKIYKNCIIGNNVIIHSGTVIGSDGFGFAAGDTYQKIPQIGNVIIHDDVEIGANVTIDRATLGSTIINKGAKLDNQIQIAHNVQIGKNTVIAALVGISGSTIIGDNVMIGGQTGFAGHLKIANNVTIAGKTGITKSITTENSVVAGFPAMPIKDWHKQQVYLKNISEIFKKNK